MTSLRPLPSEKKVFPVSSAYLAKQDVMNCSPSFSSSMVSRTATISRISSSLIWLYSISVFTASPSRVQVTVNTEIEYSQMRLDEMREMVAVLQLAIMDVPAHLHRFVLKLLWNNVP